MNTKNDYIIRICKDCGLEFPKHKLNTGPNICKKCKIILKEKNKKILILGDIHGKFAYLNDIISKKRPKITICCGDFGYWPDLKCFKDEDNLVYLDEFRGLKNISVGDTK